MNELNKMQITLRDLMEKSNDMTKDIFDIPGYFRPNSKNVYLSLGAKIQSNTLAFKVPEVKFKNESIQKLWDLDIKRNKFLELIQQLETNLFLNGIYGLGITKTGRFKLGKVDDYKYRDFKLIKLSIVVDNVNDENDSYEIIKEYDLTKPKKDTNDIYVSVFARNKISKEIISIEKLKNYDSEYLTEIKEEFIPWIIFKNNYLGNSEIENVDNSLFQMLDNSLECILRDNFWSNPFIFIVNNFASDSSKDITDSIYDFGKRVISTNSLLSNSVANPIEFYQGVSNTQNIMQKIDKLNYLIKDQMFFKMNSADFGTKNMHNAEFEHLNSNFKDYFESKANVREEYYWDFVDLWLTKLKIDEKEFEIMVPSSTKYLKSKESIYTTDLNGVVINKNNNFKEISND
ncbi:hypothetical protein [Mycoplasmopsis lipofaciens]|uniref:hypothetical protein n=1 Tax=Mycoplasmopsis lipofaciens TaxID=114884 RepID=UPI000481DA7D|nr:hypothetical protein [Mycoplasmopsis lipofaciens]